MTYRRLHPAEIQRLLQEAERFFAQGNLRETEEAVRKVLATAPENPLANHYLGAVAFAVGQHEAALKLLGRAAELEPRVAQFHASYAKALSQLGRFDEALAAARTAAKLKPNELAFQYHLGALAGKQGHVDESLAALRRAIELAPNFPGAHNDLAQSLTSARRLDEALASFRRATQVDPTYRPSADNIVYYAHFLSGIDGMQVRAEAEAWAAKFAEPLTRAAPVTHANDRDPQRRLRIGYVSPDLYEHPVGRFMQPILPAHDRAAFEVFSYADVPAPDVVSAALKASADHWIDTQRMPDDVLAQRIRDDQIDVLIDLSLHMGSNRLLAFARKPAPVQATYLGYAGTSGMSAMDWRISDPHLDPPGNDRFYTERTHRLPRSYWCYTPPPAARSLGDVVPRKADAPITFACLNNIVKISDAALEAWAQILAQVPRSGMIIQGEPGEHIEAMGRFFERAGIERRRISFAPKRSLIEYFLLYQHIDIALDPFPYAGGTSTCDALWMGVPVVTLAGQIAVHRGGMGILSNVGLTELITSSPQQYIETAVALAGDLNRLTSLRGELRPRMQASVLMKPAEFVDDLEAAFRAMWRQWCAR